MSVSIPVCVYTTTQIYISLSVSVAYKYVFICFAVGLFCWVLGALFYWLSWLARKKLEVAHSLARLNVCRMYVYYHNTDCFNTSDVSM